MAVMARETARTSPARICCAQVSICIEKGGADTVFREATDGRERHASIMRESRKKFSQRMTCDAFYIEERRHERRRYFLPRSWRAMTNFWISLVPSPMVQSLTSRDRKSTRL